MKAGVHDVRARRRDGLLAVERFERVQKIIHRAAALIVGCACMLTPINPLLAYAVLSGKRVGDC